MINQRWNSDRLLVFIHVVLTKTLCTRKARNIRARIDRRLDLWKRGIHAGLVGDALAEGRAQDGCVERPGEEEEEDRLACNFHSTLVLRKMRQAVRQVTII